VCRSALTLLLLIPGMIACPRQGQLSSLLVAGSSTVLPYSQKLAEEFSRRNPMIHVLCDSGGSLAGLIAVKRGAIGVAAMSHELKSRQDEEGVKSFLIARDGIGVVVHPSNPVRDLSRDQVREIFAGRFARWEEIGGGDSPIRVVHRKKGSKTRNGMQDIVMQGFDMAKSPRTFESAEEVIRAVAEDPGAVGYVTLDDMDSGVKAVTIEGVSMERLTILSGRYPLSRSFYYVIYEEPSNERQKAKKDNTPLRYVEFALSRHGQSILEREGLIPVHRPEDKRS